METKYLALIVFCHILVGFTSVMVRGHSVTVSYIKPMIIGRTFDLSKSLIGQDIFEQNTIQLEKTSGELTHTKYEMVKTKKQVRDILDVSGQLSLQIMSGMVKIEGKGKYLKETASGTSFVEVLAKVSFQTLTETIKNEPIKRSGWSVNPIGQHYVRGITYGGYLIASLKFEAKSEKAKEDVEASVKGNFKTAGNSVDVALEGQFKMLSEAVKDVSSLSISYTATAPLKTVPTDIESLVQAIKDFPKLVKDSTEGGRGVPIEAHLMPLSTLSDTKDPKLAFLEEAGIKTNLNELNTRYFDLIITMDAIKQFTSQYPLLTEKGETDLGKLYDKVFKTFLGFNDVIAKLDLRNSSSLIKKAFHEYKSGGNSWPGHFKSEFDELMTNKSKMIIPAEPAAYKKNGELYLQANNSYTEVAQAVKVDNELYGIKKDIGNIKNGLNRMRLLSVYIKSVACDDEPKHEYCSSIDDAHIQVNGKEYSKNTRGHNIVVVDPDTGLVTDSRAFDTHENHRQCDEMKNYLRKLQKRRIVLVAIEDSASDITSGLKDSLKAIGGRDVSTAYRTSYAMIGWTGPGKIEATAEVRMAQSKGPSIIAKVLLLPMKN